MYCNAATVIVLPVPLNSLVTSLQCYAVGKKKQRKKASTDIDALLASMGKAPADRVNNPDASDAADEPVASNLKEKRKRRERKPAGDVDALLAQLECSAAPEEAETGTSSDAPAKREQAAQPDAQHDPPEAGAKDKARKKKQELAVKGADEDIDALLAEIGADSTVREPEQLTEDSTTAVDGLEQAPPSEIPTATATPAAQAQNKKSKKKKGKQVWVSHRPKRPSSKELQQSHKPVFFEAKTAQLLPLYAMDLLAGKGAGR